MKKSVTAIPSSYVVITTIVYALLVPIFFEMDNAFGEGANFAVVDYNDKPMYTQQAVETPCKSLSSNCRNVYPNVCIKISK